MFHDPAWPPAIALSEHQTELVADLARRLGCGEIGQEEVPCLCGEASDFALIAAWDRYRLPQRTVACRRCGLVQMRPRLDPQALSWLYGSDVYRQLHSQHLLDLSREGFLAEAATSRERFLLIESRLSPQSIAEIGCGGGWNLWDFHQAGRRVVGCDYSPNLTAMGRSFGMDIREGAMEVLAGEKVDLLILSHVLEHMSDPVGEVARAVARLKPEAIYVEVPDLRSFCLGMLHEAHLYFFSQTTLVQCMARAGLELVAGCRSNDSLAALFRPAVPRADIDPEEYPRVMAHMGEHDRRHICATAAWAGVQPELAALRHRAAAGDGEALVRLCRRLVDFDQAETVALGLTTIGSFTLCHGEVVGGQQRPLRVEALTLLRQACKGAVDPRVAALLGAVLAMARDDVDDAVAVLTQVSQVAPLLPDVQFGWAWLHLRCGRFVVAAEILERLLAGEPGHAWALRLAPLACAGRDGIDPAEVAALADADLLLLGASVAEAMETGQAVGPALAAALADTLTARRHTRNDLLWQLRLDQLRGELKPSAAAGQHCPSLQGLTGWRLVE